jgi:hypothetical protein
MPDDLAVRQTDNAVAEGESKNAPPAEPSGGVFSFCACCGNSSARKDGGGVNLFGGSNEKKRRVLVVGKSGCGKSRILYLLSSDDSVLPSEHVYTPTEGTNIVQSSFPPIAFSFIEVGGSLSDFWNRSLENGVDAIWYMMTRQEFESGNYEQLLKFLESSKDTVKSKILLVSVLSINDSISTSDLEIQLNALGFLDPNRFDVNKVPHTTSRPGILASIDYLRSKLI